MSDKTYKHILGYYHSASKNSLLRHASHATHGNSINVLCSFLKVFSRKKNKKKRKVFWKTGIKR